MKIKKLTIVLLLLLVSISSFSQRFRVRHSTGAFAGDINFGFTEHGLIGEIGFTDFLSPEIQHSGYLNYETGKVGTTDYSTISLSYLRQVSLFDINESIYFNLYGGASLGLEVIQNEFLDQKKDNFSPSVTGGLEIESYITNRIAALIKVQEQYKINSELGEWSYRIQVGCRYFF